VAEFPVPRYLAETAAQEPGVAGWIATLPALVDDLARRWSLSVGEPFQPGGQCSWVAPATTAAGPGLVLKVAYRFPGGEERDEAAALRAWDGNGAVRLYDFQEGPSSYGLSWSAVSPAPRWARCWPSRTRTSGGRVAGPPLGPPSG